MKKILTPALAAIALCAPPSLAAVQLDASRAESLERALESITVDKVRSDLEFIASDELGGRDSPSPGLRIAARFIRARLKRLGWQPGAEDGYFYPYSLSQFVLDDENTFATVDLEGKTQRLTLGEDYYLSPWSRGDRDLAGPVVYAGPYDEEQVAALELKGSWVLLQGGVRLSRKRRQAAEEAGILGFLLPPVSDAEKSVQEIYGGFASRMRRPTTRRPRSFGVPQVYLSEALAEKLLPGEQIPEVGQRMDFQFREVHKTKEAEGIHLENVCGLWPGSDPRLRDEVIIVSAHYDHVGQRENGDIYNGADDNGSGTTGLMAIAEALTHYGPMRRTVMLIWVSAEEKGLLGSAAWTRDPWLPEGMRPICDINIDMIGRNATDELGITPTREHSEYNRLTQVAEANIAFEGFTKLNSADAYWSRSDHANFSRNLQIPVAFLFSDVHEDYHKPTDTADKIDYDKLRRVARLVVRMLNDLQEDELDL